jgi:TPR repeat protein
MMISSRSALVDALPPARVGRRIGATLALACLSACITAPEPQRAAAPINDPRALEADLNARLDALQHQPEPVSDDVIASLERTLREQREKRARASVAAGSTAFDAPLAPVVPSRPAVAPPVVATASPPAKPARVTKAQAHAASGATSTDMAMGPAPRLADAPPSLVVATSVATVNELARTPMSRTAESHTPVDELYARARELELQLQVAAAIGLYREASQRGHAPSSQRLMELYADGAPGVARDYRVAVFFKERAVQQGASFDVWRR